MNEIRIAAAIIVDSKQRFLVVRKRDTRFFMQAGGKIEGGEPPKEALRRELLEELNLLVDPAELSPVGTYQAKAANENNSQVRADLFLLKRDFIAHPSSEIEEAIWVTADEAQTYTLAPLTKEYLLPLVRNGFQQK